MPTRSEVLANRRRVIEFLKKRDRKKAEAALDVGNGWRCCIGHMCYALGYPRRYDPIEGLFIYYGERTVAPSALVEDLGLCDSSGRAWEMPFLLEPDGSYAFKDEFGPKDCLVIVNDETNHGPNSIGRYLERVIDGGPGTPWRSLAEYPE